MVVCYVLFILSGILVVIYKMANALAVLQGLGQKVRGKEHNECRILQINMPPPTSVDIEFKNITMTVKEGLTSKSKYMNRNVHKLTIELFCCSIFKEITVII